MTVATDAEIREILGLKTIAVVGCSSTPGKDAHEVPKYLAAHRYSIIPVNPNATEILGQPARPSLEAVERSVDIVQVFRPSNEVATIVDSIIESLEVAVLWLQLGISDPDAERRADDHGIRVVTDRCMRSEHRRLIGE